MSAIISCPTCELEPYTRSTHLPSLVIGGQGQRILISFPILCLHRSSASFLSDTLQICCRVLLRAPCLLSAQHFPNSSTGMVGLQLFTDGLINAAAHATTTRELRWLLSVFGGIIMCKIVYDLTGVVSSLFFDGYAKLNKKDKLEWGNRGFSTFHALFAATASLYLLISLGLQDGDSENELIINKTSALADIVLGFSIGYFLSDLVMIIYHFPALGGNEYVFHHGLSMFSITQALLTGQAQIYILMVLFTEITTPLINLRWYLDIAGLKKSKLYVVNGVALFFGWLVARILLFIYFFYHMYFHFHQVKLVNSLGFYSLVVIPPVITLLNLFWFWKIVRGMIKTFKTFKKAGHSK